MIFLNSFERENIDTTTRGEKGNNEPASGNFTKAPAFHDRDIKYFAFPWPLGSLLAQAGRAAPSGDAEGAAPAAACPQTIGNFSRKAKYYLSFGRLPAREGKKKKISSRLWLRQVNHFLQSYRGAGVT